MFKDQKSTTNVQRKRVLEVIRQGQIGGGESHLADLIWRDDRSFKDDGY